MVTYYTKPIRRYVVTHGGGDYDIQDATIEAIVTRRENAIDTAQIILADAIADYYSNKVIAKDEVKVYWDYKDRPTAADPPTQLVFDGFVDDISPSLSEDGIISSITLRHLGRSVLNSLCGQEYGTESKHDDIDTITEILTDNTDGIVDQWVNKVNATLINSGYSLVDGSIPSIAGSLKYVYFPYKQVSECINDLCNLVQAINGTNPGPHWIIDNNNKLLVATVGAHEAAPAVFWPTWWNTDRAGSTLIQGVDFKQYNLTNNGPEANYIQYHGALRKPANEAWTERGDTHTNGEHWWTTGAPTITVADDTGAGDFKVGASSIEVVAAYQVVTDYVKVPSSNAHWAVDKWGGIYNKPVLNFWARHSAGALNNFYVRLYSNNGVVDYWTCNLYTRLASDDWVLFTLPIGPYQDKEVDDVFPGWTATGSPVWSDVDHIRFYVAATAPTPNTATVHIDGLYFTGQVLRAARPVAAFSSSNPMKQKLITDDSAKDDSGITSDVTGAIARIAYAEYLRSNSQPIQGVVVIPGQPTIMAGQLCHIHAAQYDATHFRIDVDFRIQEHKMVFNKTGFQSILSVTSDIVNGIPIAPKDAYTLLMDKVNPEFQGRQVSSIKTREIDITQALMENSY